jgi:hypothetical protein
MTTGTNDIQVRSMYWDVAKISGALGSVLRGVRRLNVKLESGVGSLDGHRPSLCDVRHRRGHWWGLLS